MHKGQLCARIALFVWISRSGTVFAPLLTSLFFRRDDGSTSSAFGASRPRISSGREWWELTLSLWVPVAGKTPYLSHPMHLGIIFYWRLVSQTGPSLTLGKQSSAGKLACCLAAVGLLTGDRPSYHTPPRH